MVPFRRVIRFHVHGTVVFLIALFGMKVYVLCGFPFLEMLVVICESVVWDRWICVCNFFVCFFSILFDSFFSFMTSFYNSVSNVEHAFISFFE